MTQTNHDPPRVIKDPHETVHSKRTRVKRRPLKQDVSKQQWVINWNTTIKATITFQQCSSRRRDGGVGCVVGGGGVGEGVTDRTKPLLCVCLMTPECRDSRSSDGAVAVAVICHLLSSARGRIGANGSPHASLARSPPTYLLRSRPDSVCVGVVHRLAFIVLSPHQLWAPDTFCPKGRR